MVDPATNQLEFVIREESGSHKLFSIEDQLSEEELQPYNLLLQTLDSGLQPLQIRDIWWPYPLAGFLRGHYFIVLSCAFASPSN